MKTHWLKYHLILYFKTFIAVALTGNILGIPLLTLLWFLTDNSTPVDRWLGLILLYLVILSIIAGLLWFFRKSLPDGSTNSSRKAYRITGIGLFILFGLAAFFPEFFELEKNFLAYLSYAIGILPGAYLLERITPKIKEL